jgi:Lhr-like helicase
MNLDLATFEKVSELVQEGHQVMVFVHARKETVKAASALQEAAVKEDILTDFSCQDHPNYGHFRREVSASRNKEMKRLFDDGFGIHHAGMLRADRNMMEKMFHARAIKVEMQLVLADLSSESNPGFMLHRHACVGSQSASPRRSALLTAYENPASPRFVQSLSKAPKYTITPKARSWTCPS